MKCLRISTFRYFGDKEMSLTEEQIQKACDWWGEVIQSPHFDNGDDSSNGGMGMMLAILSYTAPGHEAVEKYKQELRRRLQKATTIPYLDVDYAPSQILAESANMAGMKHRSFPWKTEMWFVDGGVQVSCGYGAPIEGL